MDTEVVEGVVIPTPEPILKGTFAIYALPDGGRLIAYRADGEETTQHIPIPALVMKLWERQMNGETINPMQAFKAAFSGS